MLQAAQGSHACLGLLLLRPRGPERIQVKRAPAMSEKPAETRGYQSAHLPRGSVGPPSTRKIPRYA